MINKNAHCLQTHTHKRTKIIEMALLQNNCARKDKNSLLSYLQNLYAKEKNPESQ
jgi:hypothetical protein